MLYPLKYNQDILITLFYMELISDLHILDNNRINLMNKMQVIVKQTDCYFNYFDILTYRWRHNNKYSTEPPVVQASTR